MPTGHEVQFRIQLESYGEPQVRAWLDNNKWGWGTVNAQIASTWLEEKKAERDKLTSGLAERATRAAEASAAAATRSARFAACAIAISIVAIIVTVLIFLQTRP